ncbi:hypothetical protein CC85DRAFT_284227 [Cutaneotrichosporon oleaginosum]|uniref:Uncharacterized protein n=1 Tax=Cutaneotrichosporon oleaginosum TaxID=879819 RepID=A0A0J0XRF1_9TREE|nr:uncharacterized protein CC85DRAFT_284227 [Cutaneotrichosporon oleaginosum]KLT43716.1 hypothetical protein CC85DRAFT_284227 [Cutaneotrichosporon oleaginosum]TXT05134.1 hypothetical protein COLE_06454 [Cutaneotrichosporon oleaginosum]
MGSLLDARLRLHPALAVAAAQVQTHTICPASGSRRWTKRKGGFREVVLSNVPKPGGSKFEVGLRMGMHVEVVIDN